MPETVSLEDKSNMNCELVSGRINIHDDDDDDDDHNLTDQCISELLTTNNENDKSVSTNFLIVDGFLSTKCNNNNNSNLNYMNTSNFVNDSRNRSSSSS